MPVRNFRGVRRQIRATLFHEYTHFVAMRIHREVPAWLNEGLAQLMEGRDARDVVGIVRPLAERDALPAMGELVTSFAREADAAKVRVFYAASLSFVHWLGERGGEQRLGDLLRALGSGRSIDEACRSVHGEVLAELEAAWKRDL